jgi:WD40 repeat protein/tRNA A-37 threonylcarbamoyl transferase component Bud32
MPTLNICNECGAEIAKLSPSGLCTRCLFSLGIAAANDEPKWERAHTENTEVPTSLRRFDDYEVIEEIARGGMGVVWKARQVSLGRTVALKMVLAGELADRKELARFHAEAAAAAALCHPNIVTVYGTGIAGRQPFYSMAFIEGETLATIVRDRPLAFHKAALYVRKIAEAIHYAHERGVLHRDIKPSNILIDANDEPQITDFGLAKQAQLGATLTVSGGLLGSPNYMSPEQASGEREVRSATDIYSLGALLYHLLTGQPPFAGSGLAETLQAVRHKDAVPVRDLNPTTPRPLETICARCMEKKPEARYATAQELSEDLARFLNNQPIVAQPIGVVERLWRWSQRNPVAAAAVVIVAATIAIATLSTVTASRRAAVQERRLRQQAENLQKKADDAAASARVNAYAADITAAYTLWNAGEPGRARQLLERYAGADAANLRAFDWGHLWLNTASTVAVEGVKHRGGAQAMVPFPSGTQIALIEAFRLHVYDMRTMGKLRDISLDRGGCCPGAISPDGSALALGSMAGVTVYSLVSGRTIRSFPVEGIVYSNPAFWPDNSRVAIPSANSVATHSISGERRTENIPNGAGAVAISSDGRWVATPHQSRNYVQVLYGDTLYLKDLLKFDYSAGVPAPTPLAFSANGKWLAAGNRRGSIKVWNVADGKEVARMTNHSRAAVQVAAFSRDAKWLAATSGDRTIQVFSTGEWRSVSTFQGHEGRIVALMFDPASTILYSASEDGKFLGWSLRDESAVEERATANPWWLSHDGTAYVRPSFTADKTHFQFVDIATSNVLSAVALPRDQIDSWVLARDAQHVALVTVDREVELWNLKRSNLLAKAPITPGPRGRIGFSIDNKRVFYANDRGNVEVWDAPNLKRVSRLTNAPVVSHMFGDVLFGRRDQSSTRTIVLRHVADGRELARLEGHTELVPTLDTSWDGRYVATPSLDGTVKVWTVPEGTLVHTLMAKEVGNHLIQFSPDGRTLATAGVDGSVTLWSMATGRQVATLKTPAEGALVELLFSGDGRTLAGYAGGKMYFWRASEY